MLKRIIQLCFILIGGTLGFIYMPELIQLIGVETNWLLSPYVGVVMGGLLLYFLSLLVADYFVRLIKLLCKSKWRIGYLKSC